MNRRDFLGSALAASLLGGATGRALGQDAGAAAANALEIPLHAYSRYLHWLRSPQEIAQACREIACRYLMVTVQDGETAHVQESAVRTELPKFVNALRDENIEVRAIRGGNQTEADANVERLVATMADLGITHYWLGTDRYDFSQPITPQLDAIKRKVERFVRLNERHGTTLMYHTRSGASSVGSVVWDLLYVLRDFDPRHVGIHWDTGHMSNHGSMWETLLRTSGPYVVAVSWKDRTWKQDLGGLREQGGEFPGPFPERESTERGFGFGGPPNPNANPLDEVPLPLAGDHFARGMGWSSEETPMGTGVVDIFRYGEVLSGMGFDGIMDLQAEYPLGGAERGQAELSLPRKIVLGALKRDVLTVRTALEQSVGKLSV